MNGLLGALRIISCMVKNFSYIDSFAPKPPNFTFMIVQERQNTNQLRSFFEVFEIDKLHF